MLVANGLTGTMTAITVISAAIAVLMTVAALLLLRDVGRLERRLLAAASPAPSPPPADSRRREEAIEAKTRFLATVSHEIRTPLNGVLGMAELLAGTRIDAEQHSYVSAIRTSGEALLALIDEILDFSKIEVGKLDLVAEEVEIGALVEGVAELLAPRAQGKGIEIAASVAGDLPVRITSDGGRLRQVLINLAGNAVKFTEAGGVGITVTRSGGDGLEIRVNDTGVGIPTDRQAAIFEDFEQADGSSSRRFGGTGLGLAISRRIIEGMGGAIGVSSRPGAGSCFTVRLPLASAAQPAGESAPAEAVAGHYLLVSGGPFQAPFLAEALHARGGTAKVVKDMAQAIALLDRGQHFDAVMVDCAMGHDEARAIARAAENANVARRIVLLSPYERRAFGAPAAGGFNGYLVKPIRTGSLIARLTVAPGDPSSESGEADAGTMDARMPRRPRLRVLVAEDNDINAILATRLLERHGCEPTRVSDGLAALAAFEKAASTGSPYDVILMDIRMPGLDGLEAARRIRDIESRSGAAATRIVALTANAFPADRAACFAAGFSAFVSKPLAQASLLAALGGNSPPPMKAPRLARKA